MSLLSNIAFTTPSVIATTVTDTAPAVAFPAASKLAALTVDATSAGGTAAVAMFWQRASAKALVFVTPLGGLLFLAGWVAFFLGAKPAA